MKPNNKFESPNNLSPVIAVSELEIGYVRNKNLEKVLGPMTLTLEAGKTLAVVGPSGSGKSTLLKALLGQIKPTKGFVRFSYPESSKQKTSVVFQDNSVFPWLTALENVAFPLRISNKKKKEQHSISLEWLKKVGLEKALDKFPSELSGGMLQRVAVARALANQPDFLVLDEPFGQLDEITRLDLGLLLANLLVCERITTVLVTHSIDEALLIADRVIVLSNSPGKVVLDIGVQFDNLRSKETLFDSHFLELRKQIFKKLNPSNRGTTDGEI